MWLYPTQLQKVSVPLSGLVSINGNIFYYYLFYLSVSVPLSGLVSINPERVEDDEDLFDGFRPLIGVSFYKRNSRN